MIKRKLWWHGNHHHTIWYVLGIIMFCLIPVLGTALIILALIAILIGSTIFAVRKVQHQ